MADQRAVVAVDGDWCVVQRRQQVLLDVFDLAGVLVQAFQHKANVLGIQLEQLGFDHLGREVGPADAGGLAAGTDGLGHELDDLVDQVGIFRVLGHQQRVLDVVADQVPIFFHPLC